MKFLVIGHSHTLAPRVAAKTRVDPDNVFEFLLLRSPRFLKAGALETLGGKLAKAAASSPRNANQPAIRARIQQARSDAAVLCLNGAESAALGLFVNEKVDQQEKLRNLPLRVRRHLDDWLDFLLPLLPDRVLMYAPPPPLSETAFTELAGRFSAQLQGVQLEPAAFQMAAWKLHRDVLREVCTERGLLFVEPPAGALDVDGFRTAAYAIREPFHGNAKYGTLLLDALALAGAKAPVRQRSASIAASGPTPSHPYAALPDHSFWKQAISTVPQGEVDPFVSSPFRISPQDRVATAGSCFAQHISKRLRASGHDFMLAEEPQPGEGGEMVVFSARYGNIYTARQLLQLFQRAFGFFRPIDTVWQRKGGGFCDRFRPRIQENGFPTRKAVLDDQRQHLAAVQQMFRELDVLVFTLGLTEAWCSREDGAVYPVAPGVVGGIYDPAKHAFVNFTVQDIVSDLSLFITHLRQVNPRARLVLTVSPVPLVATATGGNVLQATVYSKSVLRVAAEQVRLAHPDVCYFPSYEIITGPQNAQSYFEADRRSVSDAGVDHVMRVFMKHMTVPAGEALPARSPEETAAAMDAMEDMADVFCDEEALERRMEQP